MKKPDTELSGAGSSTSEPSSSPVAAFAAANFANNAFLLLVVVLYLNIPAEWQVSIITTIFTPDGNAARSVAIILAV